MQNTSRTGRSLMLCIVSTAALAMVAIVLIAGGGCENIEDLTGEYFYILPENPVLLAGTASIELQAVGGAPPYRWSASDTNIGRIVGDGQEVIYISDSESGVNVITVEDTRYWTATTIVTHPGQDLTMHLVFGSYILGTDGALVILGTEGGTPPYTWTVGDDTLGEIVGRPTTTTAVYMRNSAGNNLITVTDGADSIVDAVIYQP